MCRFFVFFPVFFLNGVIRRLEAESEVKATSGREAREEDILNTDSPCYFFYVSASQKI